MRAVNFYVIIKKLKQENVNIGGLELTDKLSEKRYLRGEVHSFGDQANFVKEGDVVYYDRHAGHEITFDSNVYQVIKTSDIVIVE
jgi:co-chaperonin GroES (HSP10)